jgi:hypothetical protein
MPGALARKQMPKRRQLLSLKEINQRASNMDPAIGVALIAAVGGVLAALVQKGRKENKDDHGVVAGLLVNVKDDIIHLHHKLDHLDEQVEKVDDKIDVHLKSHRGK